jgi:hypothetical protein
MRYKNTEYQFFKSIIIDQKKVVMDITQDLKDAENALRDFIILRLQATFGEDWEEKSGVTEDRLQKWRERKQIEAKRQETGIVDERLLYYADFYDLKTILKKHWASHFAEVLGDWKTMEVWLTVLESLRDPDAHRRELLPHQKNLAIGISGEIRTRITRYRSRQETSESCFPRIESVKDNLGHLWTPTYSGSIFDTKTILRPGDLVSFVITASDPQGNRLQYGLSTPDAEEIWLDENALSFTVEINHIGKDRLVELFIRAPLAYHAFPDASPIHDDKVAFIYDILPISR